MEGKIKKYIEQSKEILTPNQLAGAPLYYLSHGEYEMAFEGLVRDLFTRNLYPSNFEFEEWKQAALKFNLKELPSFGDDFWMKFVAWGEGYKKR